MTASREKNRSFVSGEWTLEGLYDRQSLRRGVVITHPHPLYGGDMFNPVVDTIRKSYRQKGYTTLRFNFRGTGNSQGQYDDGTGEQADVRAAVALLRADGITTIALAGYSFGAWVNAGAVASGLAVDGMMMVSPPVAMLDFGDIGALSPLNRVITGGRDDIAPPAQVEKMIGRWQSGCRVTVIESADHFYSGCLSDLTEKLGRQ